MQGALAKLDGLGVQEGEYQKTRIRHVDAAPGEERLWGSLDVFSGLGKHGAQAGHGEKQEKTTTENARLQGTLVIQDIENT